MVKSKHRKKHNENNKYLITGKRASRMIREGAKAMGIELGKYNESDFEKIREIMSKGTPLSKILLEMRGRA